jgi:hypothetical protein
VFRFDVPCCGVTATLAEQRAGVAGANAEWETFFQTSARPFIQSGVAPDTPPGVVIDGADSIVSDIRVWYTGSDIEQAEVLSALYNDLGYAAGSLALVHFYVLVHTRSFLLCLAGPLIAILAVPLAYVTCAVLFGATTISFASFLSLFLIVGFGADVVFVYTDFWNSSKQYRDTYEDRVLWTYGCAAKASLATTATTALSFLANLASTIRALRQFAFFMGLCVMFAWLLVSLIYLPLCLVDERALSYWRLCGRLRATWTPSWARHVWRCRRWYLALCFACSVASVAISVPQLAVSTEVPSLFPAGHNMHGVEAATDAFKAIALAGLQNGAEAPSLEEQVCSPSAFGASGCALLWCEATAAGPSGDPQCTSQDRQSGGSGNQGACSPEFSSALARLRFAGLPAMTRAEAEAAAVSVARGRWNLNFSFTSSTFAPSQSMPRALLNEWESGAMQLSTVVEVQGTLRREGGDGSSCTWEVLTFCGSGLQCKTDSGWGPAGELPAGLVDGSLPTEGSRRLPVLPGLGRRLTSSVPLAQQAKVRVAFGITVPRSVPLLGSSDPAEDWDFLPSFQVEDPWAQRDMYRFVSELPAELKVTKSWCWMADFRNFVRDDLELQFPVQAAQFDELAGAFYSSSYPTKGSRYIWSRGGKIKAVYYSIQVDMSADEMGSPALALKSHWDSYLESFNATARPSASGAFHVSELWVNAESLAVLLTTTAQTLAILLVLAFFGMLVFTWSVVLSVYVVLATVCVMAGLLFVIVVVMGWQIGLIEVIAIVYFVGYAVTYSLHIAHKYSHAKPETILGSCPEGEVPGLPRASTLDGLLQADPKIASMQERSRVRYARTLYSLKSLGGAAVGSAMTTMLASFFLLFCTLTIFVKLGAMCLAVSALSLAMALGPLPAALMMVGPWRPSREGSCCRCIKRVHQGRNQDDIPSARVRE